MCDKTIPKVRCIRVCVFVWYSVGIYMFGYILRLSYVHAFRMESVFVMHTQKEKLCVLCCVQLSRNQKKKILENISNNNISYFTLLYTFFQSQFSLVLFFSLFCFSLPDECCIDCIICSNVSICYGCTLLIRTQTHMAKTTRSIRLRLFTCVVHY